MIQPPALVDENGDIFLHGRQGASLVIEFKNPDGTARDVSAATMVFEVGPVLNVTLTNTTGGKQLTLSQANVKSIFEAEDKNFVLLETSATPVTPLWQGVIYMSGWVE